MRKATLFIFVMILAPFSFGRTVVSNELEINDPSFTRLRQEAHITRRFVMQTTSHDKLSFEKQKGEFKIRSRTIQIQSNGSRVVSPIQEVTLSDESSMKIKLISSQKIEVNMNGQSFILKGLVEPGKFSVSSDGFDQYLTFKKELKEIAIASTEKRTHDQVIVKDLRCLKKDESGLVCSQDIIIISE